MKRNQIPYESAILTLDIAKWDTGTQQQPSVIDALEQGKVLFLPKLAFGLKDNELSLLDPALVSPERKNISYQPLQDKLTGVASAENRQSIQQLLLRHYQSCCQLIGLLLPEYQRVLHTPTNSLRLHPVADWTKKTSWRKDDSRLHIDAFPSRPNHGERILRIFTNINPKGECRSWRIGGAFPAVAQHFLSRLKDYSPLYSWLQHKIKITHRRRSHYDHLMLQLHDAMKADEDFQHQSPQLAINFPSGSSWICFSDQTPHASMGGQFMLEKTFLLPVSAMRTPSCSPLKVLEAQLNQRLV